MKSRRKTKEPPRFLLTMIFSTLVFLIRAATMMVVGVAIYLLIRAGLFSAPNDFTFLGMVACSSIALGTVISGLVARIPVRPINQLIRGMNALAEGHYETRLSLRMGSSKLGLNLEESFNILAEELQNTEMLRSDFTNNFSHEFKTPLVSIRGFAKLLQREHLSEEKRKEYLEIIAAESDRLANMATRVLDLTRLENQGILTEVAEYNLSEQLRECILLLERKWTAKNLELTMDLGECRICGNQDMLRQVWINLLDNAVKFARPGGQLEIDMKKEKDCIQVRIADEGETIPEEEKDRIFQKFYQSDTSHASQGNGVGLAIVRRIVELHEGEITVDSTPKLTTFTVQLPGGTAE